MKLGKKIIIALLAILGLFGAVIGINAFNQQRKVVEVIPVANLNQTGMRDSLTSYGLIYDQDSQIVTVQPTQILNKVYVKEGDNVKKGDPLLQFDIESQLLTIELKELEVQLEQENMAKLQQKLNQLLNTKPVERKPADSEEEEPKETPKPDKKKENDALNVIDSLKDNIDKEADGSESKPYRFLASEDGIIQGTFFNELKKEKKYAIVEVRKGNKLDGKLITAHIFDGESLRDYEDNEAFFATSLEYVYGSGGILFDTVLPTDGGYSGNASSGDTFGPSDTPSGSSDGQSGIVPSDSDVQEEYTAEELAQEIARVKNEINSADLSYRRALLDLKILREQAGDGIVYANKDGVVTIAHAIDDIPQDGSPMIKISSGEGVMVQGVVSELLLDRVQPGQTLTVSSWETGEVYTATVDSIDTYPSQDTWYGGGNPNASFYNFYAYIENGENIPPEAYLDLTFDDAEVSDVICIPSAYIRDDGKGKYVMKDVDGILQKQYVTTGQVYWGELMEVLDGLSIDDAIAFPYGNGAKEGVRTKYADEGGV